LRLFGPQLLTAKGRCGGAGEALPRAELMICGIFTRRPAWLLAAAQAPGCQRPRLYFRTLRPRSVGRLARPKAFKRVGGSRSATAPTCLFATCTQLRTI